MAKFLTTSQITAEIVEIIKQAEGELTLITPYLKLAQIFYDRLIEADNRNVDIKLIYGKKEINPGDLEQIKKLKHLGLYFCKNLHAKCYFNENLMVITSMNLLEFSQTNNREMGVQIKLEEGDKELFYQAKQEADYIIKSSIVKIDTINLEKNEPDIILNEEEQKLFSLLKSFRTKASEKENVAAFRVFHNRELMQIAQQRPKTKGALLNIKGIAAKKYEKYGEDLLKIVNEFKG